ncbi:hypothetical protein YW7DRAFT_05328 [Streptomyces sp. AmelKG-E11A]|nr:hypothetical protein YW7DRAFT_05328 [Streptomyces sp. AmelKG-E11A]
MAGRTTVPSTADQDVPPLLVKFGQYPSHHGGPGVVRGPGRFGVPVCARGGDRFLVEVPRHRAVGPAPLVRPPLGAVSAVVAAGRAPWLRRPPGRPGHRFHARVPGVRPARSW